MISLKMAAVCNVCVSMILCISSLVGFGHTFDSSATSNSQDIVPVLLWESHEINPVKGEENAALARLQSDHFEDYLVKKVSSEKPLILMFIEENLSSEDFIIGDSNGYKGYPKLQQLSGASAGSAFFPSVHAPLRAVKSLKKKGYKWISYTSSTRMETLKNGPAIAVVSLDDVLDTESRPELLHRHDAAITDIYNKILKEGHTKIIAMYTGRFSSWNEAAVHHRVRRLLQASDVKDAENGTMIVDKDNRTMLYVSLPPVLNITGGSSVELKKPTMITFDERGQMQRLVVTFSEPQKITLRFRFPSIASGYWSFGEVEVAFANSTELLLSTKSITVPFNFSYHCSGQDTIFKNGSTLLILKNFQVQPYLTQPKFSDAYDCVYFLTIPILSGFFTTIFLAIIMSWGLCMILDIKTMDRFDDPKGKTISINVSE